MPSSRKVGTNECINTYGSGKQYSALATWETHYSLTLTSGFSKWTISNPSGVFTAQETLNLSPSGAVCKYFGDKDGVTMYATVTSGTPASGDTITGASSGETASLDTVVGTNVGISPALECYAGTYDDTVLLSGATTSASYFRIIRPATGNKHSGTPSTGVIFSVNFNGVPINVGESYSSVQDISVVNATNQAGAVYALAITGSTTGAVIVGCFGKVTNAGAGAGYAIYAGSSITTAYFKNCCGYDSKTANFCNNATTNSFFMNCTSYGSVNGFVNLQASGMTCYGCGASNYSTAGFSGIITQRNCSSSAPTFVNAGSQNFHLDPTDTVWRNADTNLPTEWHSIIGHDDDIDDTTRGAAWDIGFDEVPYSGGMLVIPRMWLPFNLISYASTGFDAAEEFCGFVLRVPKTGILKKIGWRCLTGTGAVATLRVSLETVATVAGQPVATTDAGKTLYATGAVSADLTSFANATTYYTPINGSSGISVTEGDLMSVVVRCISFTSGTLVLAVGPSSAGWQFYRWGGNIPYGFSYLNSTWANQSFPIWALEYDDGFCPVPWVMPPQAGGGNEIWNSGSNPDRRGIKFKFPVKSRLSGMLMYACTIPQAADFQAILYDKDEYTVLESITIDPDQAKGVGGSFGHTHILFASSPVLDADEWYRLVILPTTANNITVPYSTFVDDDPYAGRDALEFGGNVIHTSFDGTPTSGSHAWTDVETDGKRMNLTVEVDGVDFGG